MQPTFLKYDRPLLVVLFMVQTPEEAIAKIRLGLDGGAEGFCIQTCRLLPQYRNPETYRKIFAAAEGKPVYVTNYRQGTNEKSSDEEIAEGLLTLARSGATLCDVMGDFYDRQPGEMTKNPVAVEKQKALVDRLHEAGAEVLMSSHVFKFTPAEQVVEIALAQQARGVDIVKIVTGADTMEQQLENLRITNLLKRELKVPFLFLSGGECKLHRRIGAMLGCCMYLCTVDDNPTNPPIQPQLWKAKAVRDSYDW